MHLAKVVRADQDDGTLLPRGERFVQPRFMTGGYVSVNDTALGSFIDC